MQAQHHDYQLEALEQSLISTSNQVNHRFKEFIEGDPQLQREDTLKGILHLVNQYKQLLSKISSLNAQQRAKAYYIVYNCVTYITEITSYLRKSTFSFESVKPIVECILAMEANLVLSDVKYMDKRTQLYLSLCKIYEQSQYHQPAIVLLASAIKKYKELKQIYEMDPPLQPYIAEIIENNIAMLKIVEIKINIQSGVLTHGEWKKKVDQEFKDNMQRKLLCLVQCLRTQTKRHSNVFCKNAKGFKQSLVQQGFDMVKPFLQTLSKGLKQMKEKIQFEVTFQEKKMSQTLKQEQVNQEIKKKRQLTGKNIRQSDIKKAGQTFPIEYHAQLIQYAFQVKNHKVIEQLLQCAIIRVQCRRIEVPYISNIKFEASNTPENKPKNGYEKIPFDLNEANLKEKLKKLRKSGKTDPNAQAEVSVAAEPVASGKDAKKGAKVPPPEPVEKVSKKFDEPTEWQLQQINHKYVYMHIKRSFNPEKAIFDIKAVLGHQQKGPVGYEDTRRIIVPYIQKSQKVTQSSIQQYKGIRQSTQMVPYIILHHSETNLENEDQKKTAIIDVKPIVGKNPMMPAPPGYTKLDMDLRQVPEEFVKMPDQTYIYLSYKTDEQFHISSRLIEVFNTYVDVQNSYGKKDSANTAQQNDKYAQMDIQYSLEKLGQFFVTLQDCLRGNLGQEFYLDRNDLLTHLVSDVWEKYLKVPLQQIEYIMEQRLNRELVDHDYDLFKTIIAKCKPIFLRGLKVLNLILINNKKCDILLLSKINLQLVKLLEENKDYYLASENSKLALDRVRLARDQYLSKSIESSSDRILPFSITCSNSMLDTTLQKMKKAFIEQRLLLEKVNNLKDRKSKKLPLLNEQEQQQAELQWKLNRKPDSFDKVVENVETKHSELYSLLCAIDVDISNIYFRVTLKHGEQLKKKGVSLTGQFAGQLSGLATTLVQKLGFLQTKGNAKQQRNLKQLQTTLIQAEKLPPLKPQNSRPQKRLIQESYKNPYLFSLLLCNLGALNSANQDKKYYLKESLKAIKDCQNIQSKLLDNCVQSSIFIFSSIFDSQIDPQSNASYKTEPFQDLYNGNWPSLKQRAGTPILLGKNSETIYMKLPPFIYKSKNKSKAIKYMKLFGKISANGVDVSANCDQLVGTGIRHPLGKVVKVSHLKPNNNYCFAVGPLDQKEQMLQIGETSFDIPTFNSLPVMSLAANLAKVAYQVAEYDIAEQASKIVVNEYTYSSQILDIKTDSLNKLYKLSLNQKKIEQSSLLQLRAVAESLYIMALCERKNLETLRNSGNLINCQQKQRQITNLIFLTASLQPTLPVPITSLLNLLESSTSNNSPLIQSYALSALHKQYISPKIRKSGTRILRNLMKWGLQNNQTAIARRMLYKWSERKWFVIGKIIQVQQKQAKKQVKKGGKDAKEPQQQKKIDKFCHYMIEKSPLLLQQFEDTLLTTSDEYSDMLNLYADSMKESVKEMSQSMDNGAEKAQEIFNTINSKIELVEYLKDPLNSIGKVNTSSKTFLEYNCKIIRRALQLSTQSQTVQLIQKINDLKVGEYTQQVKLSMDIFALMEQAFEADIQFSPQSKDWVKFMMEKTGKDLSKNLRIYSDFQAKATQLSTNLKINSRSFYNKQSDYDYCHLWLSQFNHLKAISLVSVMQTQPKTQFVTEYKIKPTFTNINFLRLDNLKKIQKEVEIMGSEKCQYKPQTIESLQKILKCITDGIYSAYCIENWIKINNLIIILENFINYNGINPFSHINSKCWLNMSLISLIVTKMLTRIRADGLNTYKDRFNKKLENTELQSILVVLRPEAIAESFQPLYDQYITQSYIPELSSNTTKQPWFLEHNSLKINSMSSIIVYTVQSLYLQRKNNIIINLLRDFCNVTEHWFSLDLLPVMIEAQESIGSQVQNNIQEQETELKAIQESYRSKKEKDRKKRQAQITGEKMPYEIEYEEKSATVSQTIQLLKEQKNFISTQTKASRTIIAEIQRDYNKASLSQKQHKKYVIEFGEDQENIFKNYKSEPASLERSSQSNQERKGANKLNILSKNRKNVLKDIIFKYQDIFHKLSNNKTSKDTIAEIMNRNQVGNLYYALGDCQSEGIDSVKKSYEFWNEALATIFRKVNPVDNYLEIITQNSSNLVKNIGFKQLLIALVIIYKISKFTCHKNLLLQQKCIMLGCEVGIRLFQVSLTHPQCLHGFVNYRLNTLQEYESCLFDEQINVHELVKSLDHLITKSIDIFDDYLILGALPLCCLAQYLSIDVLKQAQNSLKIKIYKSMVLSRSGFVKQSSLNLYFVAQRKDLPFLWLEASDNLKREKGQNWCPEKALINDTKPFFDSENKQPISNIKQLVFPEILLKQVSLETSILFNLSKWLLLAKIHENQIYQNFQVNEERLISLKQIEQNLRDCLRKLSNIEQFQRLKEQYRYTQAKLAKGGVDEQLQKIIQKKKADILAYMKNAGFIQDQILKSLETAFNQLKRIDIVQTISRIRFILHKLHLSKNMLANSFYILKNGLVNINRYSYGSRRVQTGADPELGAVQVAPPVQAGKKDDKKGKKQPQPEKIIQQEIDPKQQERLMKESGLASKRFSPNAFWHLKLTFELGCLLYRQNNFLIALRIFQQLIGNCKRFGQAYFNLYSQSYVERCKIRLGELKKDRFINIIQQIQTTKFFDLNYVMLVMDFGQATNGKLQEQMFCKGLQELTKIWETNGMNKYLSGIGLDPIKKSYAVSDELTAQQEEEILKKKQKKVEKKGGKQQKKGAKKDDGKKKKEEIKEEYKVKPLFLVKQTNLFREDSLQLSSQFKQYIIDCHPNYYAPNVFSDLAKKYIKCFIRYYSSKLNAKDKITQSQFKMMSKLLKISQAFPENHTQKALLLNLKAQFQKNIFLSKFQQYLKGLSKQDVKKLNLPFEDLPRNQRLTLLPTYFRFLNENSQVLADSAKTYQELIQIIPKVPFVLQNDQNVDTIVFEFVDVIFMQVQYSGTKLPKYKTLSDQASIVEQKKAEVKKLISKMIMLVEYSIKLKLSKKVFSEQYYSFSKSQLQPNVKIDEDIMADIKNIDKQCKNTYPTFLKQATKAKQTINSLDILTYLLKIKRQSQVLTFSNPLEPALRKCNRILSTSLPPFKEKCIVKLPDLQKLEEKIPQHLVLANSRRIKEDNIQVERYFYILHQQSAEYGIVYGKFNIQVNQLSNMLENCYKVQSKLKFSMSQSGAVKQRDYKLLQKPFKQILSELTKRFSTQNQTNLETETADRKLVQLSETSISILIALLNGQCNEKNKQFNSFLYKLHMLKYKLKQVQDQAKQQPQGSDV